MERSDKEIFKRTIARIMEILELSNQEKLKQPVKREIWYLYKNLYENGGNGNGRLDQTK